MAERKVLNKYFPPDFDPSKIPRRKMPKDAQQTVRLMAPFTMCCNTCGEFIYKGKKFNAKKETALGEEYYGIKIFRFYIKCTRCSSEITFKTDPKNADYICEHGAKRNFEPTTAEASYVPNAAEDDEEAGSDVEDPMKALEESQATAKRQMEDEDELADLRQRNARLERGDIDTEEVLKARHAAKSQALEERRKKEEEEDDEVVKQYFYKVKAPAADQASPGTPLPLPMDGKGKGKAPADGVLGDGYGSSDEEEHADDNHADQDSASATITVKRTALSSGTSSTAEPTVQDLLAAKGIALPTFAKPAVPARSTGQAALGKPSVLGGAVKRKEGVSGLGVKLVKKKKLV
ncbi:hypothetical protein QFC22_002733 [Naganishia vaughanmartiniae]|uniref:Uncharacterized protein n=1 Tax=Naganishia vaughanmartiniae TaxID=1424756 RepID=A0ACC2XBL3_9TREE|nr:hypothetical protein QFC22_002733 [Naganishia vaughanmartiniae]